MTYEVIAKPDYFRKKLNIAVCHWGFQLGFSAIASQRYILSNYSCTGGGNKTCTFEYFGKETLYLCNFPYFWAIIELSIF